jgi:glucose repression regulatory protein TUP1
MDYSGWTPDGWTVVCYARPEMTELFQDFIPSHFKQGDGWFAVGNKYTTDQFDVNLIHTLEHLSAVVCIAFSCDGKYIATGCNKSTQIFDVQTGAQVVTLVEENAEQEGDLYTRSVCFSPDGLWLATGAEDKIICIWDISRKKIKNRFVGHEQDIYSLEISRDGTRLASCSGDRTARLWDTESGQNLLTLSTDDGLTSVAVSPDGKFLAAGSLDSVVRIWDTEKGELVERLEGHKDSVYSVAFSPSGLELLSGSLDKTMKLWELASPRNASGMMQSGGPGASKCKITYVGHQDFVLSVAISPDGKYFISGSKDNGVQFWNPNDCQPQFMVHGHMNSGMMILRARANG